MRIWMTPAKDVEALVDDGAGRMVALGAEGVSYCLDISSFVTGVQFGPADREEGKP